MEKIPQLRTKTPNLDTNKPGTPAKIEAHRHLDTEIDPEPALNVREEILKHYNISHDQMLSLEIPEGSKREMRAFTILINKNDGKQAYYADGHDSHAELLNKTLKNFHITLNGDRINNRQELLEKQNDFLNAWEIKKGLIDPYNDSFKKFEYIRDSLIKDISQQESPDKQAEGSMEIPSWFIVNANS